MAALIRTPPLPAPGRLQYSQLRVAGSLRGLGDRGAGQRHGLLQGLAAAKGLQAKQE